MAKQNKKLDQSKTVKYGVIGLVVVVLLVGVWFVSNKGKGEEEGKEKEAQTVTLSESGDLVIPIKDISEKVSFYPLEIEGTALEVLAVKASDGTIRTAFNTCQICFSSGRGYYVQEGELLVCQNCGNRFETKDVEIARGGCNPVPIFAADKTVDENNITISNEFLIEAKGIFENWKNEY